MAVGRNVPPDAHVAPDAPRNAKQGVQDGILMHVQRPAAGCCPALDLRQFLVTGNGPGQSGIELRPAVDGKAHVVTAGAQEPGMPSTEERSADSDRWRRGPRETTGRPQCFRIGIPARCRRTTSRLRQAAGRCSGCKPNCSAAARRRGPPYKCQQVCSCLRWFMMRGSRPWIWRVSLPAAGALPARQ